jgi:alginate O-acetyltransferase complex protein AlgI
VAFNTEAFIFFFLPAFLALYYITPARYRNLTLLGESYLFYGWWRLDFLALLVATTGWTFLAERLMSRAATERAKALWCAIGVVGCLAVLGVFKYLNFFIDSFAALFGTTPDGLGIHWRILFPIGISFYIFHSISYLIDVRRGHAEPSRNLVDFAAFLALFPQLMAGPILRYKDLAHQFVERHTTWEMFTDGWMRFVLGLGMKVILADNLARMTDQMFGIEHPSLIEAWLGCGVFLMQVYFDFSGYSSMAIGLALMLGFRFQENFRFPFHARSVSEVWNRWHISLGQWLFTYVYRPLGGSKGSKARQLGNLFVVSLLGGVWHGANMTFVFWGFWKGLFIVMERGFGWLKRDRSTWYGAAGMILIMTIGVSMFRGVNFEHGLRMMAGLVGANGLWFDQRTLLDLRWEAFFYVVLAFTIIRYEPRWHLLGRFVPDTDARAIGLNWAKSVGVLGIALICLVMMVDQLHQPFLYYQF